MIGFFIVGHPKCGTTFLYNVLSHHPEIFLPDFKEPKYFCTDLHLESDLYYGRKALYPIRTEKEYLALYIKANVPILGDASPIYLFSHNAAKNIHAFNPDAKIIIVLREPVSFLRSFHFEQVFQLAENETDFIKALSLEDERRKGNHISEFVQTPRYLFYSEWVDYRSQIQRYTDLFDINNIKLYIFEDIISNEKEHIQDLLSFIGVNDLNFLFPENVFKNPSKELRFHIIRKITKMPVVRMLATRILPNATFGFLEKFLYSFFSQRTAKPDLSSDEIRETKKRYLSNVVEADIFIKDNGLGSYDLVNKWGYTDL
ncbi:MAG: sulfotransferase [Candidatus Delongbacteria bacterium]|nr:sulfotransferase [Candidatus Delongbacteria bacterium]